mmetsp:Transcript_142170/g.247772  ORF Transcript_142170/g.247772 Transcript_142170/m.247772 type:complete len:315 (-) Transcript_142170:233-1177(-)
MASERADQGMALEAVVDNMTPEEVKNADETLAGENVEEGMAGDKADEGMTSEKVDEDACCLCLNNLNHLQLASCNACHMSFHVSCLEVALAVDSRCPLCRVDLTMVGYSAEGVSTYPDGRRATEATRDPEELNCIIRQTLPLSIEFERILGQHEQAFNLIRHHGLSDVRGVCSCSEMHCDLACMLIKVRTLGRIAQDLLQSFQKFSKITTNCAKELNAYYLSNTEAARSPRIQEYLEKFSGLADQGFNLFERVQKEKEEIVASASRFDISVSMPPMPPMSPVPPMPPSSSSAAPSPPVLSNRTNEELLSSCLIL